MCLKKTHRKDPRKEAQTNCGPKKKGRDIRSKKKNVQRTQQNRIPTQIPEPQDGSKFLIIVCGKESERNKTLQKKKKRKIRVL